MTKSRGRPKRIKLEDKPDTGLNPRQAIFCEEFIKDYNGTQAAIRAGYSEKTARQIATENLTKPAIQAYIQQIIKQEFDKRFITKEALFNRLDNLSKGNMLDVCKWDENGIKIKSSKELEKDKTAAIKTLKIKTRTTTLEDKEIHEIETEIGLHDAIKATELLMKGLKYLGADETEETAKTGKSAESLKLRMKQLSNEYKAKKEEESQK